MYLRWPSAKMVSKARVDLPLPESPVNTVRVPRGMCTSTFFKLFSFAPLTKSLLSSYLFIA